MAARTSTNGYPDNPVLLRVRRGTHVESVHRGAWVLVDAAGDVVEGTGAIDAPFFVRSAIKSIQALPLFETGAAERFALSDEEIALAVSSHSGEPCHTHGVQGLLLRLGLGEPDLGCGKQVPNDPATRDALRDAGAAPTQLHNNCSGKHAGFLALARQVEVAPERYLDPASTGQEQVRAALAETTGCDPELLLPAIDGCSAPTYRLPLTALATGFVRITNPEGLAAPRARAAQRITRAVGRHPVLVAGSKKRLCTDIARVTAGRLFAKIGAEAIYAVGEVGGGRALAVKLDDGGRRGLESLVIALLARFGMLAPDELEGLRAWCAGTLTNWAGLDVGRLEVLLEGEA